MKGAYLSSGEGLQLVEDWKASGLSQKAFCLGRGIGYARFHYWYAIYRGNRQPDAAFIPVQPAPPGEGIVLRGSNGIELHMPASTSSAVFIRQLLSV